MAIDKQLSSFMPHTVTITSFSSKNNYGENTFSGSRTARAYVEKRKIIFIYFIIWDFNLSRFFTNSVI